MESIQGLGRNRTPSSVPRLERRRPALEGLMKPTPLAEKPGRELERVLLRRMIEGEEEAFEEFCDLYVPVMYRFVQRSLGRDPELTREIVQTTLSKVIPRLSSFRGESALTTWLCSCCRNEIAGHYRKAGRRGHEVDLDSEPVAAEAARKEPETDGPERRLLRRENAALVHRALDRLPVHYGKALEWKYLENLSVREIARRLELGPKAAESLLTRARQAFREGFSKLVAESGNSLRPGGIGTAVKP